MRNSYKRLTTTDVGYDPRLDSERPRIKHKAKQQINRKTRQRLKQEVKNFSISETCVCCGASLGDAELGIMYCQRCSSALQEQL